MAATDPSDDISPELPGGVIGLSDWRVPTASVKRTIKDGFRQIWSRFRDSVLPEDEGFHCLDGMPRPDARLLSRLAPEPDPESRSQALAAALAAYWGGELPGERARFFVTPPFSRVDQALEVLAHARGWVVCQPPEHLLMSAEDAVAWWDRLPDDRPWLIPDLARFWLRHRSGLALVRELLARVGSGRARSVLIGCNSWSWSFWCRYLPELQVTPATLAPLHAPELAVWLAALPSRQQLPPLSARITDSGKWVLTGEQVPAAGELVSESLFRDLAALSRGISGVALAIWRSALRVGPDDEGLGWASEANRRNKGASAECDCWVVPLDQLSLPTLPATASQVQEMVLHGLLLHGVLDRDRLTLVTGVSGAELDLALLALTDSELVSGVTDGWQVSALAYPSVRRGLQAKGYPVDEF